MKKFFRVPYEEESAFSYEELKKRLSETIERQKELHLYKLKGSALFLLSDDGNDEYTLRYYNSYKKDMCDTCLRFYLVKGLERSGVKGFFCKPRGIWAFFWGVIASVIIDFIAITYGFLFSAGFNLETALMISGSLILLRAYICMSLMQFGRERVKVIKEEMLRLLRQTGGDTDTDTDVKGEADEDEGN